MSTQSILTVVGTVVGSYFGYPQLGALIGSLVGSALEPDPPPIYGPRIEDRRVQTSTFGVTVPLVYGGVRLAGNVMWAKDLEEVATENEIGGKGGPTQSQITYSYYGTFAVLLCKSRTVGFSRIWADTVLIFDSQLANPAGFEVDFAFYEGTEDQLPDPEIEADVGVGRTPAYRGYSYIRFSRLPLERFGNRLPSITIELMGEGVYAVSEVELPEDVPLVDPDAYISATQLDDKTIATLVVHGPLGAEDFSIRVQDPTTGAILREAAFPDLLTLHYVGGDNICYVPPLAELWVTGYDNIIYRFNAQTLALIGTIVGLISQPRIMYDHVRRKVFWRNGQRVKAGGTNVVLATSFDSTDILNAARAGYFTLEGEIEFEAMDAIVGTATGTGFHPSCYDLRRKRYVNIGDEIVVITDTIPPVITRYSHTHWNVYILGVAYYDAPTDSIVILSQVVGQVVCVIIDAETFDVLYDSFADGTVSDKGAKYAFGYQPGELIVVGYSYELWRMPFFGTTVGATVADLCQQSGLQQTDYDVSELPMRLRGYLVSQFAPARGAIEQLMRAFLFECTEQDDQIYFRRRGGETVATITAEECGAEVDRAAAFPISKTRGQEADLPKRVYVVAPDPLTDYQTDTQYAERAVALAGAESQMQLAVVLNVDDSRRLAFALLFDAWVSRERRTWSTTRRYALLVPSDPIALAGERVRVLSRTDEGALIRFEGVVDDPDVIEQYMQGVQGEFPGQVIAVIVPTSLIVLDIALLEDAQNYPGAYLAAYGPPGSWRGGVLYSSVAGVSWEREATLAAPGANVGTATTDLGYWYGANVFDEANRVNVSFRSGEPSSTTRLGVLNGENAFAIEGSAGWEIVQYRDVVLEDDGTYTFTGFLRGRRGTEYAMIGHHAVGSRVVLLSTGTITELIIDSSDIGIEQDMRAVSVGDTLANTENLEVTITAERLKPWSPVHLGGGREANGDAALRWKRRSRIGGEWRDDVDASLGEESEAYEVEIYSDVTFSDLRRTISGLSSEDATYTLDQQTEDFGGAKSPVSWKVYQLSEMVGRGHGAYSVLDAAPGPVPIAPPPPAPPAPAGTIRFRDTFTGAADTALYLHTPDVHPTNAAWGDGTPFPLYMPILDGAGNVTPLDGVDDVTAALGGGWSGVLPWEIDTGSRVYIDCTVIFNADATDGQDGAQVFWAMHNDVGNYLGGVALDVNPGRVRFIVQDWVGSISGEDSGGGVSFPFSYTDGAPINVRLDFVRVSETLSTMTVIVDGVVIGEVAPYWVYPLAWYERFNALECFIRSHLNGSSDRKCLLSSVTLTTN